jgi:hypothetical protein
MRQARLEKDEQHDTVRLLQMIGARVYVLGTRRPRGTRCPSCGTFVAAHPGTCQTPGLPDLVAFLPRPPLNAVFIEQKRGGGRLSPDQEAFRQCCRSAGVAHLVGTRDDIVAALTHAGYLR